MNLRPRHREEPEINLTPLIDVVFLMLIFFMVSTTFLHDAKLRVSLPKASDEPSSQQQQSIELTLNAQGNYFVNGRALVNGQVETIRRGLAKAIGDGEAADTPVVIRADAESAHRLVVRALDAAGQAGLQQVGIATVPRKE